MKKITAWFFQKLKPYQKEKFSLKKLFENTGICLIGIPILIGILLIFHAGEFFLGKDPLIN